jgi:hypothetical protein
MNDIADNYAVYYADKLWNLLPAVYRTQDTDQFDTNGPLRELVNRVGAQAAVLRRSIDRLWEDQSIETCDDWVIPYIGDLLGTRLVSGLDLRGQRLDVAKTIYYRRRKGTVAILEEIAANITGWDAKVVEFFRRLGRTRHGFDPAIGLAYSTMDDVAQLQRAEGLAGALTRTQIGGFADLRNAYGALKAHTAFDEYFHTADFRVGQGNFGWYNIPHLGVFLWRLISFGVGPVTPVPVLHCPGWYSFDPTGREIPLFAVGRASNQYGDNWVSPVEGQLPTPISQALLDADLAAGAGGLELYPNALAVSTVRLSPPDTELVPAAELVLRPAYGLFAHGTSPPQVEHDLVATYHYGFPSEIGAGAYDRRIGAIPIVLPAPAVPVSGGGEALARSIPRNRNGTLTLADSLTYSPPNCGPAEVSVRGSLTLRAGELQRPLIRLSAGKRWVFSGATGSSLVLEGLFVSGADIVLCGKFDSVTLSCCTLDPGSAAPGVFANRGGSPPPALFAHAVDGRELAPTRLWVEGSVTTLRIDRCVLGPIRTRGAGTVETLTVTNSIVQAIRTSDLGPIEPDQVKDAARFERLLQLGLDPVSALLRALSPGIATLLGSASPPLSASPPPESDIGRLLALINKLIADPPLIDELIASPPLYGAQAFARVPLSAETQLLRTTASPLAPAPALNRLLLEDAYPLELADAALAFAGGSVTLSRCTILGRVVVHRLDASECILQDLAQVDDTQDGCVRFCAWSDGSIIPRQYESVRIPPAAPLFTTTDFGQPGYAQLLPMADAQILPPTSPSTAPQNTIFAGAEDGSEMGAYARDKNPIKQRALLLKFQEFMPAGLVPVVVIVT